MHSLQLMAHIWLTLAAVFRVIAGQGTYTRCGWVLFDSQTAVTATVTALFLPHTFTQSWALQVRDMDVGWMISGGALCTQGFQGCIKDFPVGLTCHIFSVQLHVHTRNFTSEQPICFFLFLQRTWRGFQWKVAQNLA